MKCIDSEKMIAEIEKIIKKAEKEENIAFRKTDAIGHVIAMTKTTVCVKIKKLISSLQQEQPEVDLEKEIENYFGDVVMMPNCSRMTLEKVARRFYELGLNARKEENK